MSPLYLPPAHKSCLICSVPPCVSLIDGNPESPVLTAATANRVPDVLRRSAGAYATDRPATLGVIDLREVLLIKSMETVYSGMLELMATMSCHGMECTTLQDQPLEQTRGHAARLPHTRCAPPEDRRTLRARTPRAPSIVSLSCPPSMFEYHCDAIFEILDVPVAMRHPNFSMHT
jgi:hypothetical protein